MASLVIDVRDLVRRARRWLKTRAEGATVNTGFISFPLTVNKAERTAARKLLIRLRDKRVFTAEDCCDDCVRNSIASLQDVRAILVGQQADLADHHEGQLFWVIDYMLATIRAFLTWDERTRADSASDSNADTYDRERGRTHHYIEQLDVLRAHVRTALQGMAVIAEIDLPSAPTNRELTALARQPRYLLTEGD